MTGQVAASVGEFQFDIVDRHDRIGVEIRPRETVYARGSDADVVRRSTGEVAAGGGLSDDATVG
ncbi:unannotated protein [freshwater metagenome]|uniref:Unannotated protein n=1 Tax=freshwater metagenome TaxID=449393 RepID=A0A6J6I6I7_9ZZZZ